RLHIEESFENYLIESVSQTDPPFFFLLLSIVLLLILAFPLLLLSKHLLPQLAHQMSVSAPFLNHLINLLFVLPYFISFPFYYLRSKSFRSEERRVGKECSSVCVS